MSDYTRINPAMRTVDDYIAALVDYGFITDEVTQRCDLEGYMTKTKNIEITLSAKTDEDSEFCFEASESITAAINNPSTSNPGGPQLMQVPEVLQFASAAVAAPNEVKSAALVDESSNVNGATVLAAMSYFTLLLLAFVSFTTL